MRLGSANQFPTAVIIDVLRQAGGPMSTGKRRELADSLVARAISPSLGVPRREDAVLALRLAGNIESRSAGTPNRDALDRLIEIHRRTRDANIRSATLGGLSKQIDPGRALPYLKSLVLASDDKALAAKQIIDMAQTTTLPTQTRTQATALLRELYDTEAGVLGDLCRVAIRLKWPPPKNGGECV